MVERAHRLGRYMTTKRRPAIVRFLSLKDRQRVLSVASKLKGKKFAISEGYGSKVRQEAIINSAKNKEGDFKLQYNKLKTGKKAFIYDANTRNVNKINP